MIDAKANPAFASRPEDIDEAIPDSDEANRRFVFRRFLRLALGRSPAIGMQRGFPLTSAVQTGMLLLSRPPWEASLHHYYI